MSVGTPGEARYELLRNGNHPAGFECVECGARVAQGGVGDVEHEPWCSERDA